MPILNNEVLDDPLVFDGDDSFSGGQVSLVKPSILVTGQSSELVNMDINRSGRLVTRIGTTALGTPPDTSHVRGTFFYDWTSDYLMRVSNGVLRKWDSSSWTTVSGFTPNAAFNVEMCQLQGKLYLTNGTNIYYWDGSASPAAIVADTDAPACKYLVTHAGRVFAGGLSNKDGITWSSILDASSLLNWDVTQTINVGGGDGEGMTGLCSWQDYRLLVFKRNSIYALNADPTVATPSSANWSVDTISRRIGCVAHRSIQQVGNDVFFLSDDGVRSLGRTLSDQQVGISDPSSEPIQDIIGRINWAYIDTCSSAYFSGRYMLSIPVDSSTTPNYVLVFNRLSGSWSGYWTGWKATGFALVNFNGTSKLCFCQSDGKAFEWLGWKAEGSASAPDYFDAGTIYPSSFTSRGYSFGDYLSHKTGHTYEVEFYSSNSSVLGWIIADRGGADSAFSGPTQSVTLVLPLDLPFLIPGRGSYRVSRNLSTFGQFYSVQLKLEASSGKLSVQGVGLSAFLDTINGEQ